MLANPKAFASRPWPDPLDRGLVGEWRFDRDTGLFLPDYSGNDHNGTAQNNPPWIVTPYGMAMDFQNASSHHVEASSVSWPSTGGPVTVELFTRVDDLTHAGGGFGMGDSYPGDTNRFQANITWSDGNLYWDYGSFVGNGRISTSLSGYQDIWVHIILVSQGNGGSYKAIYLDGVLKAEDTGASDGPDIALSTLRIGRADSSMFSAYYEGPMALFRIYDRLLSAAEIAKRYEIVMRRRMEVGAPHLWRVLWGGGVAAPPAGIVVLRRRRM